MIMLAWLLMRLQKSTTKEPVTVVLNNSDKYFGNRCTIARISNAEYKYFG